MTSSLLILSPSNSKNTSESHSHTFTRPLSEFLHQKSRHFPRIPPKPSSFNPANPLKYNPYKTRSSETDEII
jgi:hypothetical protein